MPYPNKLQWVIIWIAVLVAAHVWMGLRLHDLWPGNDYGGWGLPAYLDGATHYARPKLAFTVLVIGALLVWMASGKRRVGSK